MLAVAGQLEHALGAEDVGLQSDADLLVETRRRAVVEDNVGILGYAAVVLIAQVQLVLAQVSLDKAQLGPEVGPAFAKGVEYLRARAIGI